LIDENDSGFAMPMSSKILKTSLGSFLMRSKIVPRHTPTKRITLSSCPPCVDKLSTMGHRSVTRALPMLDMDDGA